MNNLFAQLVKVDAERRLIYGRAVDESFDRSGEIFDYATSKPLFQKWSEEAARATDGASVGNLRAMHGKVAAGKLTQIDFDDATKTIDVVAKVVDDNEWKKVLEGVYTGFSIGGSYAKKWDDPTMRKADGKPAQRYTAAPSELSLVDRPCVPSAKFFEVRKADGTTSQQEFITMSGTQTAEELAKTDEQTAEELAKAAADAGKKFITELHDGLGADCDDDEKKLLAEAGEHFAASEDFAKGDFAGHPFRGNQHVSGESAGAVDASMKARGKETKGNHSRAAKAHASAAKKASASGRASTAAYHSKMAAFHSSRAGKASKADEDEIHEHRVEGNDEDVAKLAELMQENKLDVATVVKMVGDGLAAQAAKADADKMTKMVADGELRKGFYTVARLANIVSDLTYMAQSVRAEEANEGDVDSPLPAKSVALLEGGIALLTMMVEEEGAELLAALTENETQVMQLADFGGSLSKAVAARTEAYGTLAKYGARNSQADSARIQNIHDLCCELGGTCATASKTDEGGDLVKADALNKIVSDAVEAATGALIKRLDEASERIASLESQPAAPRGVLLAVAKSHDNGGVSEETPQIPAVVQNGEANEAATLIKMAHKTGGVASFGYAPLRK